MMSSKIEDLSTELWLEIFSYLKIRDQFNTFFNLNTRLNRSLLSYRSKISCKNNDEDAQYLFTKLLPKLLPHEDVISLRLENIKRINLDDHANALHFPYLTTLILHRLNITKDFLDIFQHNITHIRYLNISPVVSGDKKNLGRFLGMILSIPNLQICRLRVGLGMCSYLLKTSPKSPVKTLKLNGINEVCFIDRLIILLQHFPCLQSLHIVAQQLNFIPTVNSKNIFCTNPISNFILNIQEFTISFVQFTDLILTLTPNVQELKIINRTSVQNFDYLDHRQWLAFIKLLPDLKTLTLDINRGNEIDKDKWDKRCQIFTKLMSKNHIISRIGK